MESAGEPLCAANIERTLSTLCVRVRPLHRPRAMLRALEVRLGEPRWIVRGKAESPLSVEPQLCVWICGGDERRMGRCDLQCLTVFPIFEVALMWLSVSGARGEGDCTRQSIESTAALRRSLQSDAKFCDGEFRMVLLKQQ